MALSFLKLEFVFEVFFLFIFRYREWFLLNQENWHVAKLIFCMLLILHIFKPYSIGHWQWCSLELKSMSFF